MMELYMALVLGYNWPQNLSENGECEGLSPLTNLLFWALACGYAARERPEE
jgi:hypothetical protein